MTIDQFKYVIEVSKSGSISNAANKLFISQAALSNSIKKLEEEVGDNIFIRSAKGISLTPFGEEFLSHIKPICLQVEQIEKLSQRNDKMVGLSIATSGFNDMSIAISKIYKNNKNLNLKAEIKECSINEMIRLVSSELCDFGILRRWSCYHKINNSQLKSNNLHFNPIITLDVGITVGPQNPLFNKETDSVSVEELKNYPSIMYAFMDEGPYSDIYSRLNIPSPPQKLITDSRAQLYELLYNTDGYTLNSIYNNTSKNEKLNYPQRTLKLENCDIKTEIGWISSNKYQLSALAIEALHIFSDSIYSALHNQ